MVSVTYFFRGNPLFPPRLFPINSKGSFYRHIHTDRTAHITTFDGLVVDHWLDWKIAQTANAPAVQDQSDDRNLHRWMLYHMSYVNN